jgi:hypothetical protein
MKPKLTIFLVVFVITWAVLFFGVLLPFKTMFMKVSNDMFPGGSAQDFKTFMVYADDFLDIDGRRARSWGCVGYS